MSDTTTLSEALTAGLARVWSAIQHHHPGVPSVVLLPAPAQRGQRTVLGHFAPLRWQSRQQGAKAVHEVVVVAEWLTRDPVEIVCTVLHEAAHAADWNAGVIDCSVNQYHNQHFEQAATAMGLMVEKVPNYGYARTTMAPETIERYAAEIASLGSVLIHRHAMVRLAKGKTEPDEGDTPDKPDDTPKKPGSRMHKATCQCGYVIRLAAATYNATHITCGECGERFLLDEDKPQDEAQGDED